MVSVHCVDLFNVTVFIRASDYNIMPRDQLIVAQIFPVPFIPIDSSQILPG